MYCQTNLPHRFAVMSVRRLLFARPITSLDRYWYRSCRDIAVGRFFPPSCSSSLTSCFPHMPNGSTRSPAKGTTVQEVPCQERGVSIDRGVVRSERATIPYLCSPMFTSKTEAVVAQLHCRFMNFNQRACRPMNKAVQASVEGGEILDAVSQLLLRKVAQGNSASPHRAA